jgi:MFS family permease
MPAIGRETGVGDFWVAVSYTWSAVLWVLLAPFWAEKSDHHGRKLLTMMGVSGFIVSMLLCGITLFCGLHRWIGGALTFSLFGVFRAIYGGLGCATPSATQAYLASKTRRSGRVAALSALSSSFGLGTIIGPAVAPLFVLPFVGLAGPLFAFAVIGLIVVTSIAVWLPNDRAGRRVGHGAAMSYPSLASPPTGASVTAATQPRRQKRLSWKDPRVRPWIIAGVVAGHAQAATLTCLGFFVIDRLHLLPSGSEGPIAIVMMAGAVATLGAQWGLIPRLGLGPRPLILWGALIAAAGLAGTMLSKDLYGITIAFAVASVGFGFTRPGFTAGASLAVPLAEQGAVAGVITAANGISYVLAPALGMGLYELGHDLPFAAFALVLLGLVGFGRNRLAA